MQSWYEMILVDLIYTQTDTTDNTQIGENLYWIPWTLIVLINARIRLVPFHYLPVC